MKLAPFSLILIFLFSQYSSFGQQDPIVSQYNLNQSTINPAYSGLYNRFMGNLNVRNQWTGLDGNPATGILTVNSSIIKDKLGAGLLVAQDKIGIANTTETVLMAAYSIGLDDALFSFGLRGGFINVKQNQDELMLKFLDDPDFIPITQSSSQPNFGVGISLMNDDKYYFGFSIPRLLNVEFEDGVTSSTVYKRHFYLSGAILKDIASLIKLKPGIQLKYVEGAPLSYDISASILWNNRFWFGVYTRNFSAQGGLIQFLLNDIYRFGYSFEIPTSSYIEARSISHEIVIGIDLALFGNQDTYLRYF